jgi:hypothetical protein
MNSDAYKHTLLNRRNRIEDELAEAKLILKHSPQIREAQKNGPFPDVYYGFKRKARQARVGAYAMWLICILFGSAFIAMSYGAPRLEPWISAPIASLIWVVVTTLIGVPTGKVAQFGLNIHASAPFSVRNAVPGIWFAASILAASFAGLLVLQTSVNWPLMIAVQTIFQISATCAGSFFHALYEYFIEVPNLRDQIMALEVELDRIGADLAMLEDNHDASPTARFSSL